MDTPRIRRARNEIDGFRVLRIPDVHDRDAVAERLAEVRVAAMEHDLHAVAAAGLIGVPDERDVAGGDCVHDRRLASRRGAAAARDAIAGKNTSGSPYNGPLCLK